MAKKKTTKKIEKEQLKKVLAVSGMQPSVQQLDNIYELSKVIESIIHGDILCSECGKKLHLYEIRCD